MRYRHPFVGASRAGLASPQAAMLVRWAAPPLRIEPASLGFDSVLPPSDVVGADDRLFCQADSAPLLRGAGGGNAAD